MKIATLKYVALVAVIASFAVGCEKETEKTEWTEMTMRRQEKYGTQMYAPFFRDGSSSRTPVENTVAVDAPVERPPVSMALLERGQQRFTIYCSMCHGQDGMGDGMVPQHGFPAPPSFHTDRLRGLNDQYIFNVVTNGLGKMPPYAAQVPVADRWAIVSYIRALQRSQYATINDVPESMRATLNAAPETQPTKVQEGAGQ